jgi:hypothetical protein
MVADLPGIALILAITIVAGVIAYIGDRVGHQVGRKRLTLFGLRPKYTSTVVAVATGMLIALSVTLAALIGSGYVRTAFFRIGQLNAQINQLQAQAVAQENELKTTRNNNIAITKASPVAQGVVLDVTLPEADQLRLFSQFFDDAVRTANVTAARLGLQPDLKRSSDPQVRAALLSELQEARTHFSGAGDRGIPLLFLPVAPNNLFRGDRMTFIFAAWADRRLYGNNEEVASIDVEGGRPIAGPDYRLLETRAFDALAKAGFPYPFFAPPSGFDPQRFETATAELTRVKGRFRLVARSEGVLYPHTSLFVLGASLEPAK